MRNLLLAFVLVFAAGCAPDLPPEDTVRAWFAALAIGDAEAAFALLDDTSREQLERMARTWQGGDEHSASMFGPAPEEADGTALLDAIFHAEGRLPALPADHGERVGSARITAERAEVAVRGITGTHAFALTRTKDHWRIALKFP